MSFKTCAAAASLAASALTFGAGDADALSLSIDDVSGGAGGVYTLMATISITEDDLSAGDIVSLTFGGGVLPTEGVTLSDATEQSLLDAIEEAEKALAAAETELASVEIDRLMIRNDPLLSEAEKQAALDDTQDEYDQKKQAYDQAFDDWSQAVDDHSQYVYDRDAPQPQYLEIDPKDGMDPMFFQKPKTRKPPRKAKVQLQVPIVQPVFGAQFSVDMTVNPGWEIGVFSLDVQAQLVDDTVVASRAALYATPAPAALALSATAMAGLFAAGRNRRRGRVAEQG